jgi:hypothetical protein
MPKPTTGAAAAAAALGAWLAAPVVAMRQRGTLDEQHASRMRREPVPSPTGGTLRRENLRREHLHREALRRARVREAQVRAAVAALPRPRSGFDDPRSSPLHG